MYRRQFLQTLNAMGASIALPASAFYDEGSSVITPTTTQPSIAPTKPVEVAHGGWDVPKVGIVVIGRLGNAMLNELTGRLPYLSRAIAIHTDATSLKWTKADRKILLGNGKALPFDSCSARLLAQSYASETADAVAGLDMVFLVTGMDCAASTCIAPVVARVLREQGILTLAFAAVPLNFESQQHEQSNQIGLRELRLHFNALLPFSNGSIRQVPGHNDWLRSLSSQAALAFDQLWQGILNPVCRPGWINIDFDDLKHLVLSHSGDCAFGFGFANSADGAARTAIHHPLLGLHRLQQASAVLVTVRAPTGILKLADSMNAMRSIRKQLPQDPWILYGTYHDDTQGNEITVSVLASGIPDA